MEETGLELINRPLPGAELYSVNSLKTSLLLKIIRFKEFFLPQLTGFAVCFGKVLEILL